MKENTTALHINIHQELRFLCSEKWITEGPDYKLEAKAITLIQQVDSYFRIQKKKTSNQLMGNDFNDNIVKYLELFPRVKLPSGKPARSDKKNIETAFRWFFETHEYSWDIILRATALYVDDFERKGWLYMQTSQYFIRKQQSDKTWGSELANCCATVDAGDEFGDTNHFPEKVV